MNLSEMLKEQGLLGPLERLELSFYPDRYWASSLYSFDEEMKTNPPRKSLFQIIAISGPRGGSYAAVTIPNLEITRVWPDNFDEDDGPGINQLALDHDWGPAFILRDSETKYSKVAIWGGTNYQEYLKMIEEYGINREGFVLVPKTDLFYAHNPKESKGIYNLWGFRKNEENKGSTRKKKTLKEKLLDMLPEIPEINLPSTQPRVAGA